MQMCARFLCWSDACVHDAIHVSNSKRLMVPSHARKHQAVHTLHSIRAISGSQYTCSAFVIARRHQSGRLYAPPLHHSAIIDGIVLHTRESGDRCKLPF
jgi:hypothetical protein